MITEGGLSLHSQTTQQTFTHFLSLSYSDTEALIFTMQSSISLSSSYASTVSTPPHSFPLSGAALVPSTLGFCGLHRKAFTSTSLNHHCHRRRRHSAAVSAALSNNGTAPTLFDYDLLIIGAGVGGHGAALHAVEKVRLALLLLTFGSLNILLSRACSVELENSAEFCNELDKLV